MMKKLYMLLLAVPFSISSCVISRGIRSVGYFVGRYGVVLKVDVTSKNNIITDLRLDETISHGISSRDYMSELDDSYSKNFVDTFPMIRVVLEIGSKYCLGRSIEEVVAKDEFGNVLEDTEGRPIVYNNLHLNYVREVDLGTCDKISDNDSGITLIKEIDARSEVFDQWIQFSSFEESYSIEDIRKSYNKQRITFVKNINNIPQLYSIGGSTTSQNDISVVDFKSSLINSKKETYTIPDIVKGIDGNVDPVKYLNDIDKVKNYFLGKNIFDIRSEKFVTENDGKEILGVDNKEATLFGRSIAIVVEEIQQIKKPGWV